MSVAAHPASATPGAPPPGGALLQVENLVKRYPVHARRIFGSRVAHIVHAVDGVSFSLRSGETLGLVGESGCGKTTTARSILHLVDPTEGSIRLDGADIMAVFQGKNRAAELAVRRRMQYVFQDPYLSLNPRWTIAQTIFEPFRVHGHVAPDRWNERLAELMDLVGLEAHHAWRYPHEFSGGQRQRVGIARALAVEPELLILDEPVSSLDVSVRAQILNLMTDLQERLGLTYLYISHDLSSVRFVSDRVAVMYLGRIVEIGEVDAIFERPAHHYTRALLGAIPVPDPTQRTAHAPLEGEVPSAFDLPRGCRFHPRCKAATARCREETPVLRPMGEGHEAACHHPA
ncbi:ABC transporter ATP-binding protein [Marinivivus vitaminiproducens]|uniref:ABC transporter ATP-binding protein n=1 Tax=Marinivivus vitaminiproducens TaxID=3035935 RepID=UPI0027A60D64|nr:ABC transporter ATP-binding protein [Geminicoccaceae bacterium SCSIO 64248]